MCDGSQYIYKCPRIAYPCENMFFPQNQRPEGLAECLLTGLSFLEAWLNPLDHGKFPILQKLQVFSHWSLPPGIIYLASITCDSIRELCV